MHKPFGVMLYRLPPAFVESAPMCPDLSPNGPPVQEDLWNVKAGPDNKDFGASCRLRVKGFDLPTERNLSVSSSLSDRELARTTPGLRRNRCSLKKGVFLCRATVRFAHGCVCNRATAAQSVCNERLTQNAGEECRSFRQMSESSALPLMQQASVGAVEPTPPAAPVTRIASGDMDFLLVLFSKMNVSPPDSI